MLARLLETVPDRPEMIDTRGLLIEGAELFGEVGRCVAVGKGGWLLAAIGEPRREDFERALSRAEPGAELLATGPAVEVSRRYLDAPGERAFIHAVGPGGLDRSLARDDAVLLADSTPLDELSVEVAREILEIRGRRPPDERPAGAVMVGERLASVCYSVLETERYWDVSIETVSDLRRGGRAAAAFLRVEREMARRGLEPVWGAHESNRASQALAKKLGFRRVGEVVVFELG